jgi:hypothetical protein
MNRKILLSGAAAALIAVMTQGCFCADQLTTVKIPHRHNLDSITIKDGFVEDVRTHKRAWMEEPNTPRQMPLVRIIEKPE